MDHIAVTVSFGDLVKTFRKQKHLKQMELADRLGVHYNTISKWERGMCLPDSKGMVLELAKALHLNEHEARALLETSLAVLSPYWSVPHRRNPFFTGREEILDELHACLHTEQTTPLTLSYALHGLGGIGKTQIALEYAYRHLSEYHAIFWIEAETPESIVTSIMRIAEALSIPERWPSDPLRSLTALQRWLATHSQWLLIWDNLEDLERLSLLLPSAHQGANLITTQGPVPGTVARGLELPPMKEEEGRLLLLQRAKLLEKGTTIEEAERLTQSLPTEYQAAEELVIEMGGLPLALDQAGAYIEETGCSISSYLYQFKRQHRSFLDRRGAFSVNHPHSVVTTLRLSCQHVEQRSPAAFELLRCCAFLSPDAIPEELFGAGASQPGSIPGLLATDPSQFDFFLAILRRFALVQRQRETQTLSIHRLVQLFVREEIGEQEQAAWLKRVAVVLKTLFPPAIPEKWKQCERLLPHVLACAALISDQAVPEELTEVLQKAADYLRTRAQYEPAQTLYERALRTLEQRLGPDHPDLAPSLNGLASLMYQQGKYESAQTLYERALRILERARGPEHPDLALPLNGLASLSYQQGKYEPAQTLYERALRILEQRLGPDHPDLAPSLNGLASLSYRQGKYEPAQNFYERALRIQEQALGPDHPDLALSLHGLVYLFGERAQYEQAQILCERALHIQEQALDPEHPLLAVPLGNLALIFVQRGKYDQAQALYERALRLQERARGPEHPFLAPPLTNLANLFLKQGKYDQAQALYERALRLWEQAHGPEHPNLAYSLSGLADLFLKQGKYDQAQALYTRSRRLREQAHGPEHPNLAYPLSGLADLFLKQGKYDQAQTLYERALLIQERARGPEHPDLVHPLSGLADLFLKQSKYDQAQTLYERALLIQERARGPEHPDLAYPLSGLANLFLKQSKYDQAQALYERALLIQEQTYGPKHPETIKARQNYHSILEQSQAYTRIHIGTQPAQSRMLQANSVQKNSSAQRQDLFPPLHIVVQGSSGQVAYTREVNMREVTITCVVCGQTVTLLRYPGGRIKYCSEACKTIRETQINEERVRKQREKRRTERELLKQTRQ